MKKLKLIKSIRPVAGPSTCGKAGSRGLDTWKCPPTYLEVSLRHNTLDKVSWEHCRNPSKTYTPPYSPGKTPIHMGSQNYCPWASTLPFPLSPVQAHKDQPLPAACSSDQTTSHHVPSCSVSCTPGLLGSPVFPLLSQVVSTSSSTRQWGFLPTMATTILQITDYKFNCLPACPLHSFMHGTDDLDRISQIPLPFSKLFQIWALLLFPGHVPVHALCRQFLSTLFYRSNYAQTTRKLVTLNIHL